MFPRVVSGVLAFTVVVVVTGTDLAGGPSGLEDVNNVFQNVHFGELSWWSEGVGDPHGLEDGRALQTSTSTTPAPFCSDPDNLGQVCNIALGCGCIEVADDSCGTIGGPCEEDLSEGQTPFTAPYCTLSSTDEDVCVPTPEQMAVGCMAPGLAGRCAAEDVAVCFFPQEFVGTPCATDACPCNGVESCACFWGVCLDLSVTDPLSCADDSCQADSDCDMYAGEICCPTRSVCEVPVSAGACGDPHMTGFRGQKFDFIGEDGEWYCVLDDGPALQLNMRVTSPVVSMPEITYITGISIMTTDEDGVDHTLVLRVTDPHNLESSCLQEASPCLADGALTVEVDEHEVLLTPGTISVGPGVAISAVNLPGACRSFGFEQYWESKKLEYAKVGRKLDVGGHMQDMAEWILGDPTATNMDECVEYVVRATAEGVSGLFVHESEHASFQIMTPRGAVRLSHGRLHQISMRDPTDQFDLPDHMTWQMNLAVDHNNVSPAARGILGETLTPTVDGNGNEIMQGMAVIRGSQEDYRVGGALDNTFALGKQHE